MNEEIPFLPVVVASCIGLYLGYEINRRRHKLRRVFNTFDKKESKIADLLEQMVESGQLTAYSPGQPA